MRWFKWLKSRLSLPFRAPRIAYIQRDMYLLRRRRWFRSAEALERYIKEGMDRKKSSSQCQDQCAASVEQRGPPPHDGGP